MNIDAAYVKSFTDAGYKNLPIHDLVAFKSMDITPEFVKSLGQMGYGDVPAHDVIAFKSMI